MRWTEQQLADHLERNGVPGRAVAINTASPPFELPGDVVIDLPFPPSVNRLWRSRSTDGASQVYLSPSYVKWKKAADAMALGTPFGFVPGAFEAAINVCPPKGKVRGDLDNRIKAVLDWLQRVGVVADDKHCQRLMIEWVDAVRAPHGCRVFVRPCA
jgi:crossover junction endodeoxyribonuclease RusA